jgi:hypothetical protein
MKNSPCFKCEKRKVTADYNCHTDCPDYAEYRREIAEVKKKNDDSIFVNYMITSIQRRRKKKNEKNRT